MAYVIAEPCIGTKDTACVDACPVDCIHPKKDEPGYAEAELLYIDPVVHGLQGRAFPCVLCRTPSSRWTTCRRSGTSLPRRTQPITASNLLRFLVAFARDAHY